MPDTERPPPMTPELRAHLYEHGSLTCAVPRCSLCPELAKQFRAAEAPLRERVLDLLTALAAEKAAREKAEADVIREQASGDQMESDRDVWKARADAAERALGEALARIELIGEELTDCGYTDKQARVAAVKALAGQANAGEGE